MDYALWLLIWLRFTGWVRRFVRGARTVRGALLLVVGLGFMSCMCINPLIAFFLRTTDDVQEAQQQVRFFGPVGLFVYCLLTVVFSSSEKAITFAPPEIDLLFPGPFTRRQLLLYKIAGMVLACLGSALFMTALLLASGVWIVAAYPGLVLTLTFVSLFGIAVGLIANTLGAHAYNRWRRVVLALVLAAVVVAGIFLLRASVDLSAPDALDQIQQIPAIQYLLLPFRWFGDTITAKTWYGFLLNGTLALSVNLALVLLILLMDAQYLEASAIASEKFFAEVQRIRRGGAFTAPLSGGKPRFRLPMPPWLGGVGPIAWRQMTTAIRSLGGVAFFLVIFSAGVLIPLAIVTSGEERATEYVGHGLVTTLLVMSVVMLPSMTPYDFRGDVDRMDVLKTLPIRPWAVVVGQLIAPVILMAVVQLGLLLLAQLALGGMATLLFAVLLLVGPINFLTIAVDNLLFLVFPARMGPQTAGDFQSVGRQMIQLIVKVAALGIACGTAAVAGLLLFLLTGGWKVFETPPANPPFVALAAGVSLAAVVLLGFCTALVPLLAWAFVRFDVTRDTPA